MRTSSGGGVPWLGVLALLCVTVAAFDARASGLPSPPGAKLVLRGSSAKMVVTSTTDWTLEKSGAVDPATQTVSWSVSAIEGTTSSGHLFVLGTLTVLNRGTKDATIGNVMVNLMTWSGQRFVTRSSDIADATQGDAATSARVVPTASLEGLSFFTENAASGPLSLMDARTNSVFSLVPQPTIAPGEIKKLLFSAEFDANELGLPEGTWTRTEIIVSFGNAGEWGRGEQDVDINGNGVIDPDEAHVKSVPARFARRVPPTLPGNATVTLTDQLDDLTSTGTVVFSDPVFDLGPTEGSVTARYDAGTEGGTITNCAHLTSPPLTITTGGHGFPVLPGLDLEACDTQVIDAPICAPGAPGCGWQDGDVVAHNQTAWGEPTSTAAALLDAHFDAIYPSGLQVGGSRTGGFSIIFTLADALVGFLPSVGASGPLTGDLLDPTSSAAGVFGGEVVALQLNVDLADAGVLAGSAAVAFGDLTVCGTSILDVNGQTVRQVLTLANSLLGGGSAAISVDQASEVALQLNSAFASGRPSSFAQAHLVNGPCGGWQVGQLITFTQSEWGGATLTTQYDNVYASSFGVLEIGIPGASGFSLTFTNAPSILTFLPQITTSGPLVADLVDPTSTSAGWFGGEVLALRLNVDFSDAGVIAGSSGLRVGDLRLCGHVAFPNQHDSTVREILALAETALGGASPISTLNLLVRSINAAFSNGNPSRFAQDHLVNGACGGSFDWQTGDVISYAQGSWDEVQGPAAALLLEGYNVVYLSTFGVMEVGIPGAAGFSIRFTDPVVVLDYFPASGASGALTNDVINPTATTAGAFGGSVVALQLNVDFADAGLLVGTTGVPFGDLTLCNFYGQPLLNGTSVRAFLGQVRSLLGGGSTSYDIATLAPITGELNLAFDAGVISPYARYHLAIGACP